MWWIRRLWTNFSLGREESKESIKFFGKVWDFKADQIMLYGPHRWWRRNFIQMVSFSGRSTFLSTGYSPDLAWLWMTLHYPSWSNYYLLKSHNCFNQSHFCIDDFSLVCWLIIKHIVLCNWGQYCMHWDVHTFNDTINRFSCWFNHFVVLTSQVLDNIRTYPAF